MTDKALSGQVALVTGASRGIGAATAEALAAAGAHVILVARTSDALEAVEDRIHASGGSATIAPLDLMDGDSIAKLATAIAGRWDALDMLVLNAAMLGTLSPVAAIDGKEINRVFTLNVLAQNALIAAFNPMLRRAKSGRVIAITSSVGSAARPFWGAYGASKAALERLIETYGEEMRNTSPIRTALIDPGATRTQMRARAYPGEDPNELKSPDVVGEAIARLCISGFDSTARIRV
jgi:NAD(P)-dependent dehydrogenase (short-subunit alcohol dehydrogenase family)